MRLTARQDVGRSRGRRFATGVLAWALSVVALAGAGAASASAQVFWSNNAAIPGTIGRANLDGSGVNQSFITGASGPTGWPSTAPTSTGPTSRRARSGEPTSTAAASTRASSPAPAARSEWRSTAPTSTGPTRQRHDRAGEPRRQRRQPELHHRRRRPVRRRGRRRPRLLDQPQRRHDRAGQPRRQRRQPELHHRRELPDGVAVDGAHVYWTNHGTDTIGRANLDGSGANQSFITGAGQPGRAWRSTAATSTGPTSHRHDRAGEPRRQRRQPELHHRRQQPASAWRSRAAADTTKPSCGSLVVRRNSARCARRGRRDDHATPAAGSRASRTSP